MRFSFFVLALIFFTGCSSKINLSDYHPIYVPKSNVAPKSLKPSIKKISLLKFPPYYFRNVNVSENTFYALNSLLQSSRFVKILRIIDKNQIKEEIKAAEISKETSSSLGADYLLEGRVLNATYTPHYHKGYYYYVKTKHGKIRKYSPPYYSYEACVELNVKLLSLPQLTNDYDENFIGCKSYYDNNTFIKFYPNLVLSASNKAANTAVNNLKKFFAPKGYIYEARKDGDDIIAKITLGSNQGMKEGMELNIYRLQKDPVTGEIEKYKIGEGEVSNIIFANSCWIKVDLDDNQHLEIGDMVTPTFNSSFWDIFK